MLIISDECSLFKNFSDHFRTQFIRLTMSAIIILKYQSLILRSFSLFSHIKNKKNKIEIMMMKTVVTESEL